MTSTNFWNQWMSVARNPRPLPKTIYYGDELGEGDCIVGAATSKGVLIALEFDEIDDDTEVTMLYVRRQNGQMDLITHDTVYVNTCPVSFSESEKK